MALKLVAVSPCHQDGAAQKAIGNGEEDESSSESEDERYVDGWNRVRSDFDLILPNKNVTFFFFFFASCVEARRDFFASLAPWGGSDQESADAAVV